MSGHSHWASIRHKKGAADAKKGQMFSKLAKNIMSAAKQGGGDPEANLKLKYAIEKAKQGNMPKDRIARAIKKGTGELPGESIEELVYEGYGPGGVALMIEVLTDNRNRTAAEIRKLFEKRDGKLAGSGAVSWMFESKGLFAVDASSIEEDELFTIALDAGAEDVQTFDEVYELTCAPGDFAGVKSALEEAGLTLTVAELTRLPQSTVTLDEANGRKIVPMVEELEEHDDVQNVYSNFDLPPDLMAELASE